MSVDREELRKALEGLPAISGVATDRHSIPADRLLLVAAAARERLAQLDSPTEADKIIGSYAPFWTLTDWIEEGKPEIIHDQTFGELVEWWQQTVREAWKVINSLADALIAKGEQ